MTILTHALANALLTNNYICVKDFGAVGDGVTDDTAAIQSAINSCNFGGELFFPWGKYKISDELVVDKPLLIRGVGKGSFINDSGSFIQQTNPAKNCFTLRATLGNYAFAQYGIIGVCFKDICLTGPSNSSRSTRGIGVDFTVNSGNFHIRDCSFENVNLRYFNTAIELVGIAYLNSFSTMCITRCGTGISIQRGNAPDLGGQTRFYSVTCILIDFACVLLNTDTSGGSFSFFGCTLSESKYGIYANEETTLSVMGCEFESLVGSSGDGAGIYIPIVESNPNAGGTKTILGNKFLTSDADIWFNKTTTAFADDGFFFPVLIDGNVFGSVLALKITVPNGHTGITSQAFVFGSSNSGLNNGALASSQISSLFYGTDLRKKRITKRYSFNNSTANNTLLDVLPSGFLLSSIRVYLTANASSTATLRIGDQANNQRYFSINAQTQGLNAWVNYTTLGDTIDTGRNQLRLGWSTGLAYGCTGVIEIDGFTV